MITTRKMITHGDWTIYVKHDGVFIRCSNESSVCIPIEDMRELINDSTKRVDAIPMKATGKRISDDPLLDAMSNQGKANFIDKINAKLQAIRMTKKSLAEKIHETPSDVYKWLTPGSTIPPEKIKKIIAAIDGTDF